MPSQNAGRANHKPNSSNTHSWIPLLPQAPRALRARTASLPFHLISGPVALVLTHIAWPSPIAEGRAPAILLSAHASMPLERKLNHKASGEWGKNEENIKISLSQSHSCSEQKQKYFRLDRKTLSYTHRIPNSHFSNEPRWKCKNPVISNFVF